MSFNTLPVPVSLGSDSALALSRIDSAMPEILRASKSFGRSNSQVTAKLMSLSMLTAGSPYRVLRQCLAEIEKRRDALKEVLADLKGDKKRIEVLRGSCDELGCIEADRIEARLVSSQGAIEGALKDIAAFQDAYDQVRRANNIREDWDELDFEKAETDHHTRTAFLHSYRDVMAGGLLGMGTLEYLEQFGIHPHVALAEAKCYVEEVDSLVQSGHFPDASHLYAWLDKMVGKHGKSYLAAMKRLGLQELHTEWAMYLTRGVSE